MTNTPTLPEGFISWEGGPCPVPDDMLVSVMFGDGAFDNLNISAKHWEWSWLQLPLRSRIIAYRPDPNYVVPIDWKARAEKAEAELVEAREDYSASLKSIHVNVRLIDIALHGEAGAAKQASACDLVEPARRVASELADLRVKAEKLAAALGDIARQKLLDELDEEEMEASSFEDGFDACVKVARAALAEWENSNG